MNGRPENPRRRISITYPVLLGTLAAFWIGATIWAISVTYDARKCESAVGGPASNPQNQTEFAACKKFLGTESERFSDYSEEVNGRQNLPQGSQNLPQRR